MRAKTEPRRRLVASRSLVWQRLFLVGPMEVNAWTVGSNGPTEMCGVIPKINGGYTGGKSGWGILGKKDGRGKNEMARWLSPPVYSSGSEMPVDVREGVSVVLPEEGTWTDLEPAYETVMLDEKDTFLWIETIWTKKTKDEHAMARRRTFLEDRPLGIEPPREVEGGIEVSLLAVSEGWHPVVDWVGVELVGNMVYLVTRVEWRADEHGEWNPDPRGHVRADGRLYMSEDGWHEFGVLLASGEDPLSMFEGAWQLVWEAGFDFADPEADDVTADLRVAMVGSFELPSENIRMRLPPFLLERLGGLELVRRAVADLASLTYEETMIHREYYRAFLEMGPFSGEQKYEVLRILHAAFTTRPRAPVVGSEVLWGVVRREISRGMTYVDDLHRLYEPTELGKEMASQEQDDNQQSRGSQGTNRDEEQNEGSDQESAKPEGTKEEGKGLSTGESSGKVGGSKRGPQENREGRDDERVSPRNSGGTTPKKTKVLDARRKLAEIERRTAKYKARLIEQMMVGNEEDLQGEGLREGRRTSQGEARYGAKDNSHKGTPSKKGKEKGDSPAIEAEKATTPPAIDNGASRVPTTPKATKGCDGLWSLRERVLGWFDPEGIPKTGEKHKEGREGEGKSAVGEAGSSEGGLKRIVATLTRALNKNQGYLADAKKKLTFDGANITKFVIDYENLAALLKWTEEEKMDHVGQHVSLSLGRDIMAIVSSSGSWKETRNEMMRKYLKAEKMATEVELAAVQRKNYTTYNDFLRAFTLVAVRIPRANFILEGNGQDRVNITTRRAGAKKKLIQDTVKEELAGTSADQQETEAGEQEKVYGKAREEELVDKVTAAKKKFRYQIPILTSPEIDGTLSKLLGTMVSVSFQTMLQASPRLLKGLRQLLTRKRVEVEETAESQEQETEGAETPQGVSNLQRIPGDLEDLEKAFADICLSLPDREGGEVMRAPPGTKLSFHALPVGKLKVQMGTRHTDALRPYTAMHTPVGQLQMQVTPMGFTNAVAEAQRRMLAVAGDMFPKKCEPYIDDNPIKGARDKDETEVESGVRKFVWDHLQDIKDLLQRFLVYNNITASGPKSILAVPEVTILGFRCGAYGRKPDPAKTDKISQWPTPLRTTTEVRAFLGVVGFWRIFIKGFAKIAEPIRAMIREGGTMEWTEDREVATQTLKDILSSDQVTLAAPCFNDEVGRPFILETDGGPLAVGGVLIQKSEEGKERPIRFESRTLNSAERRYSQFKKEVLAILHCLKTFQAYLFGRRFILRIDPTNVVGALKNYKPIDPTVGRWIGFIWQFDYKMYEGVFREIGLVLIGNKQPTEVSPKAREKAEKYVLRNDHLFKKEEGMMPRRVVCGRSRQLDIIQAMHDGLAGGHRSSKGTLAKIAPLYFWPGMAGMVATYCQTCLICQERSSARVFEPLRPTRVLGPGHLVHLDLAVMPVSTGGWYIMDARDNLSGYVEAVALKRKTGKGVADWIEDFYLRHPFVRRFIADNGTEFVNQEVLSRLKTLHVPIKIIEPYHPEANAPVERGHQTLKNTIAKLAVDDLGNWPRFLKQAVFSENMTPKRTTGCIPAELWYGREIDFPVEALIPTWNRLDDDPHLSTEESIVARCQQVIRNEEALEEVVNRVMDSRMRDKARWDQVKNIRKEPLQVGEKVLVRNSALESTWSGQLGKRFKGPYRIAKRVGDHVRPKEEAVPAGQSVGDRVRSKEDVVPAGQSVGDHVRPKEEAVPAGQSVNDHARPKEDVVPAGQSVGDHVRPKEDVVSTGQSVGDHVKPKEDVVPAGQSVGDLVRLKEDVVPVGQSVGDHVGDEQRCGINGVSAEGYMAPMGPVSGTMRG
ncbi:hypothetical protein CBR_g3503 [Chara braunii]|uniref:Integrase catalytic domain-containing protein n=1 Tax=Chara braunii TaxID=69332 RepID=A0A388KFI1_CHABU|nr:hypothetical protein CBR_g3503 [Chara braunii]|eukprot:GBG68808.1 hypothetical protein CBR_g3503 [Chara braunii]